MGTPDRSADQDLKELRRLRAIAAEPGLYEQRKRWEFFFDRDTVIALLDKLIEVSRTLHAKERELADERAIVDRIWDQLGRPSYEALNGRSIYDLIDELKVKAQSVSAAPQMADEAGWLIENGKQGEDLRYRTIKDGWSAWTACRDEAIRFARRVDAEMFSAEDEDAWCITEHVWHSTTTTQPAPQGGKKEDGWISVKERLPAESQCDLRNLVLIWFRCVGGWRVQLGEISCGHWRPVGGNGNFDDSVTHWMPLPSPPSKAEGE